VSAVDPQDLFDDGVIWDLAKIDWPPQDLADFFAQPIGDLYTFLQSWVFPYFPDAYITDWFRPVGAGPARGAKHSLHHAAAAFDVAHPDPSVYPTMAALADAWSGGPPTPSNNLQGFWTAPDAQGSRPYLDGAHFHVQAWIGGSQTWLAWINAATDAGFDV
jgi:hypothetical protein